MWKSVDRGSRSTAPIFRRPVIGLAANREDIMKLQRKSILILIIAIALPMLGQNKNENAKRRDDLKRPLVIASQGSFFVGGESKTITPTPGPAVIAGGGEVTVNQMYVQYQTPPDADRHVPVVMVHGCCLSSKTWETTPDGRMGWNEYFVRKGRAVYLADQSSRARSGFDATKISAVKAGAAPPSELPNILFATHQTAWSVFRFGPKFGEAFPDGQFPIEAVDELYKQMIPDLNGLLP